MKKLTIEFPDDLSREEFIGWFLDGGGEQDFNISCEMHDIAPIWGDIEESDRIVMHYIEE